MSKRITDIAEVKVGMPATVLLYTDTRPGVVVKVNPKSIVVAEVDHGPERRENDEREPFPVLVADGILDKVLNEGTRYMYKPGSSTGFANGSVRVVVGYSVKRTDYRY